MCNAHAPAQGARIADVGRIVVAEPNFRLLRVRVLDDRFATALVLEEEVIQLDQVRGDLPALAESERLRVDKSDPR